MYRDFETVAGAVIVPRVAGRKSRTHPCPSGGFCAATSPFSSTFIVSPPVYLHTVFLDDFFGRPFPYTQVEATPLWRICGDYSPLSKETSRVGAQKARASSGVCQTLFVCERSHREMIGEEKLWR